MKETSLTQEMSSEFACVLLEDFRGILTKMLSIVVKLGKSTPPPPPPFKVYDKIPDISETPIAG